MSNSSDLLTMEELLNEKEMDYRIAVRETKKAELQKKKAEKQIETAQEALSIVQKAVQLTQNLLAENLSSTVTLALEAVYENPYEFVVDFVKRRNSTECDLLFKRDDSIRVPLKEGGFGPVDIAAIAIRVAIWSMHNTVSNTICLDEPFRNLSKARVPLAGEMLEHLSDELGIQFIISTHEKDLAEKAEKGFIVEMKNGISTIQEINKT